MSQLPGCVRSVHEYPADLGAHRLLQKVVQVVVTYVRRLRALLESQDDEQSGVLDGLEQLADNGGAWRGRGGEAGGCKGEREGMRERLGGAGGGRRRGLMLVGTGLG